jgi:hypothetical protein
MDLASLSRPRHVQLDHLCSHRKNGALYETWQKSLRDHQAETLVFWGQGDWFTPVGGEAYLRDVPRTHRLT